MTKNASATQNLWEVMRPTFERILEHPFITGLADGSLPADAFVRYLVQDSFYLEEYARCWALLGARSPEIDDLVAFTGKIASSLAAEQEMQRELLAAFGHSQPELRAQAEPTPTCVGFTSFIKDACGNRVFHEGFVAVLECPWAYWELGKKLAQKGSPDRRYQKWIDGYASGEIEEATLNLHVIWERIARYDVHRYFVASAGSTYERGGLVIT